jgi:uncharacterized protein
MNRAHEAKWAPATSPASRVRNALRRAAWVPTALALTGCTAAPALNLYMLSDSSASTQGSTAASDPLPPRNALVIQVARVQLPEYLDSRDLVLRRGDVLERSSTGRWASPLPIAATDLLTAQLAMRRPDAWVTDQAYMRPPDYRLIVHVDRLDITSSGTGLVEADWEIVPRSASREIIRGRTQFSMQGSVASDEAVVHFERLLLSKLAGEIDVSSMS